jgi:hypothetical protein
MLSSVMFIFDYQKSSFSHFGMLKYDSTIVVLAKAFANSPQNIRNAQSVPLDHPIPY